MATATETKAIKATVRALDQVKPGWRQRVNPRKINMFSTDDCVIGQVYGDYFVGLHSLRQTLGKPYIAAIMPAVKPVWWQFLFFSGNNAESLKNAWRQELQRPA